MNGKTAHQNENNFEEPIRVGEFVDHLFHAGKIRKPRQIFKG